MDSSSAYQSVLAEIGADPEAELVGHDFNGQAFGNFWIDYDLGSEVFRFVNDRGQLFHGVRTANKTSEMILGDIRDVGDAGFRSMIRSHLGRERGFTA